MDVKWTERLSATLIMAPLASVNLAALMHLLMIVEMTVSHMLELQTVLLVVVLSSKGGISIIINCDTYLECHRDSLAVVSK